MAIVAPFPSAFAGPPSGPTVFAARRRACKMRSRLLLAAALVWLLAALPAWAQPAAGTAGDIEPASLETALFRLPAGDPSGRVLAVLTLVSAPGWHAYAVGPAESGQSAQALLTAGAPAVALSPPGTPTPHLRPEKTARLRGKDPVFVPVTDACSPSRPLTGR